MFCKKCGKKILDDSKFCPICGFNLESSINNKEDKEIIIEPASKKFIQKFLKFKLGKLVGTLFFISVFLNIIEGVDTPYPILVAGEIFSLFFGLSLILLLLQLVYKYLLEKATSGVWKIFFVFSKYFLLLALILVMIGSGMSAYYLFLSDSKINQDVGNMIKDVIYNTNTAPAEYAVYSDVIKEVFDYYKSENDKTLAVINDKNFDDLLTPSSFKSVARLEEIVRDVNIILDVLDAFKNGFDDIVFNSKEIINSSSLSQEEKKAMIEGFDKSVNDPNMVRLRRNYWKAEGNYFRKIVSFYEFLILNFDDYEVSFDENFEENIFFYSDINVNTYNDYFEEFNLIIEEYDKAENEYFLNAVEYGVTAEDYMKLYE